MTDPVVSHGRGGAGNIGEDRTEYTDGEIVREGESAAGNGSVSTGRGGQGNITTPGFKLTQKRGQDVVPEAALRARPDHEDYHVGRGGEGNAYHAEGYEPKPSLMHEGLADKLKHKIFGNKRKSST